MYRVQGFLFCKISQRRKGLFIFVLMTEDLVRLKIKIALSKNILGKETMWKGKNIIWATVSSGWQERMGKGEKGKGKEGWEEVVSLWRALSIGLSIWMASSKQ